MKKNRKRKSEVRTQFFSFGTADDPFVLSSGASLPEVTVAYETYGELSVGRDNAILLFHAMTASQHAAGYCTELPAAGDLWSDECHTGWWDDFIGSGKALDTDKYFIICANYLGSCYGTTGPASINPLTGKPYGSEFPKITTADMVASQVRLLDHLGIDQVHATIGASIGGMLCLTFATLYPERARIVIPIGTGTRVTPLQRLLNFEQALAIEADANFNAGDYYDGKSPEFGLAHARMIAHKTFVSLSTLESRARRDVVPVAKEFQSYEMHSPIESYMLHQGRKFVRRFDANCYLRILEAWQTYDLLGQADAKSLPELFARCREQNFLVFSIDSDVSFYPDEQQQLVYNLKCAKVNTMHITVHSEKGHDSFLLEPDLYTPHLVYTLGNL